jgi:hypothetical protein
MRLFEVDQGSAREVLAVLQGLANKDGNTSEIPFKAVLNILRPFALGIATPDGLIALKNNVDPQGDVIQDIKDDGTVILNTTTKDPNNQEEPTAPQHGGGTGPGVDQMASHNAQSAVK